MARGTNSGLECVFMRCPKLLVAAVFALCLDAASYDGPRPPAKDVPYLKEATKLVATELQQSTEEKSKSGTVYTVSGATSSARTPIPEPIFLFASGKIDATTLELAHFTVKDGKRELVLGSKKSSDDDDDQPLLHLTVRKLDTGLYEIEAAEMLQPGEYALSPQGSNTAFCFTVY